MAEVADLAGVDAACARVYHSLSRRVSKIWVRGQTGSGRGTLADRLARELPGCVRVDLLGLGEPDAAIHCLLQAEAALRSVRSNEPLADRARLVARSAGSERTLVVKVPTSWDLTRDARDADDTYQADRLREILGVWLSVPELRIVLLTGSTFMPQTSVELDRVELPPSRAFVKALVDESRWKEYAAHARAVHEILAATGGSVSPLMLRLAVAVVALNAGDGRAVADLPQLTLTRLIDARLIPALGASENRDIRGAVARFVRARRPLPAAPALAIARPPKGHEPLFTECLAYGDGLLRVTDELRRTLFRSFAFRNADHETHHALANHHASLDGKLDPRELDERSIDHWLEKVHHLAHGGAPAIREWERQTLTEPDFFIDRARALSVEEKDYGGAADLYRRCTRLAPDNAYAWHYLAFNLARAGLEPKEAEDAFREAVKQDRENPWWNGRLVTYLIENARYRSAESEWRAAIDRVDPDGERVRSSPWLARHLHRWVVEAWLGRGEVARAREVFQEIPSAFVAEFSGLAKLEHRLLDAEDVVALGASVHPPGMPIGERWKAHQLPEQDSKERRRLEWFPGRVVEASATGVVLVFAVPAADPTQRRVLRKRLSAEEWRVAGSCPPETAHGYVEIGSYGEEGESRIVPASLEFLPQPEPESEISGSSFVERKWGSSIGKPC